RRSSRSTVAPAARALASVSSVEALLTTTTSSTSAAGRSAMTRPTERASLKAGMRTSVRIRVRNADFGVRDEGRSLRIPHSEIRTREARQRLALQPHHRPVAQRHGTQPLVEVDGEPVPVEDDPVEAGGAAADGFGGDGLQEREPEALPPEGRAHEEVLEVEPPVGAPRRVDGEEEGEAGRLARLGL